MKTQLLVLAAALALCASGSSADTIPTQAVAPVYAELLADLHSHKLAAGATVFARVTADWHGTGCALRSGAILEAHVISVVPYAKPEKISQVGLAFTRAQCSGREMGSFPLLLAAVEAPPHDLDLGILSDPVPNPTPASFGAPVSASAGFGLISNQQSMHLDTRLDFNKPTYQFQNQAVRVGEVSGIHGLKLSVGTDPESGSVLSLKGHDLLVEKHSLFLLIPAQGPPPPTSAGSKTAQPEHSTASVATAVAPETEVATVAPVPIKPPVEEVELCEPPQCNVALPAGDAVDASKPDATISIQQLGYSSRPQKFMTSFENDEAVAWLGPRELLVAFNPHILATRHALGPSGMTVRVIRAALIDTATHRVTRTVDWELPDDSEYLWPLAEGAVLVHVASELRIYGENLQVLKRMPLDGPLSFVRVTPNSKFIVVGIVHERHSPELHAFLKQSLGTDPEEDVSVLVLNRDLGTIAQSTSHSGMLPPTLLNEGQARLVALPGRHYLVSLLTWDNNASTLAHFDSGCTPNFTSFSPDLIFVVGCNTRNPDLSEYRVLRSNGKLALKGAPTLNGCGHAASGSANDEAFVVKTVQSARPLPVGAPFSESILDSEELTVYRADDDKRLFGVRVGSPSSSRDGYALSPDGSQLAVLARGQISLYSMPAK
jgi:hypothetical protein